MERRRCLALRSYNYSSNMLPRAHPHFVGVALLFMLLSAAAAAVTADEDIADSTGNDASMELLARKYVGGGGDNGYCRGLRHQ